MHFLPTLNSEIQSQTENLNYRHSYVMSELKYGVWLYFLLLIFEGALRKWILPGLASPLLIIRDPIALWLIVRSIQVGIFKPNGFVLTAWVITLISLFTTLLIGHGNLLVALYGLRIFTIHFPVIFVIGKVFDKADVLKLGSVLLWIGIFMTLLVAIQFYSPQSAWVNRGIGGDLEGSGFSGAKGYFRVPGTFSFTTGLSSFYGLVGCFIYYFWLDTKNRIPKLLLVASSIALVVAVPLSISRIVFFQIILSGLFAMVIAARKPQNLIRFILALFSILLFFLLISNFEFFQTAIYVFTQRFESASKAEGGVSGTLIDRFLGGSIGALANLDIEIFGKGLGIGTNAGAKLMTGERGFLISEGEWGRLIGEMGIILGIIAIAIRGGTVFKLFRNSWKALALGNILPWLLLSFAFLMVFQGQWAQPTALGFGILSGGLVLASLNNYES